jgi:membrane fusion protein (multidrug efflux system)
MPGIFRKEALDALQQQDAEGALIRLVPGWSKATYWVIVVLIVTGLTYSAAASMNDYARGMAVVRVDKRLDVATASGGIVAAIEVKNGMHVKAGQTILRFQSTQEDNQLAMINRDVQTQTLRLLRNPSDESAKATLASLRSSQELAMTHLKERALVAPRAGVVANLRSRIGTPLTPGEVAATIVDENSGFNVVALVPGSFRPMLKAGLKMRMNLEGFPHTPRDVIIDEVGSEVIGPTAARQALGQELADSMPLQGHLVLVRGHLTDKTFKFEGKTYTYSDGIPGQVDIRVRSIRLLVMMFPMFKEILRDG